MTSQVLEVLEGVINEQAQIIQTQEAKLSGYRIMANMASARGRDTKFKLRTTGRPLLFVKIMKAHNQKARRDNLFTPTEKQLIFDIEPFIDFSGLVTNEDKTPMSLKDIEGLCGWSKRNTLRAVKSLVQKGLLEKIKKGKYTHLKVHQEFYKCGR